MSDEGEQLVVRGHGLTKKFKDFWGREKVSALNGVDVAVKHGEIFGLLGPNGAGKSTLIKLILGHLYPTNGRLSVLGKSPRDVSIKQRMGYLPERSQLYKQLTADETLRYFGELLGLGKAQIASRTEQLLEMVGLSGARKRKVGEFSHGMGRRLGLAQALLNDPDFLILDEPTAGLDPIGCREVKDLIITLGKRGKTVLLTSHLLADVEDVCDRAMILFGGKVQANGTLGELLKNRSRVRFEFPRVSDEALAKAKAALTSEISEAELRVDSPTESLEQYFLRMVADRQTEATAGARMGKGVADFLQDESAGPALDEAALSALAESAKSPEPVVAVSAVDSRALDELSDEAPPAKEEDKSSLRNDILDDLTG
ncbi:MAG: ABC-2 type transport system ATP-binding protein [Rhodothermales bacterium]|jgi:ABC-2 type transport system ATP-binding protein